MRLEDRIVYSAAPLGDIDMDQIDCIDGELDDIDFGQHDGGDVENFEMADLSAVGLAEFDPYSIDSAETLDQSIELVFVDAQTENYEQLVDDLLDGRNDREFRIVMIEADTDGVALITETLQEYSGLDAIHIVSHGTDGRVQLGNTWLDHTSLFANSGDIAQWGDAMTSGGDLLIYGCDLAATEDGRDFIDALGELTELDIAASEDLTGHGELGGNWEFEFTIGTIGTDIAFSQDVVANWHGTLASVTVTTGLDVVSADADLSSVADLIARPGMDGLISLREAVIAANANPDFDTINLQAQTYALTDSAGDPTGPNAATGDLDILHGLTIKGIDAASTTVSGTGDQRIFSVFSTDDVIIEGVSLLNGATEGGAIRVQQNANLELSDSILSGNNILGLSDVAGGALWVDGTANVTNTLFLGNGDILTTESGGAIFITNTGIATLDQVEISGNEAVDGGGGIHNEGQLTVIDSYIHANETAGTGGGIWQDGGPLVIESSTLAFNRASDGGGLFVSSGATDITNSTFSGNNALTGQGGAIYLEDDVSLTHATIAYNNALGGANGIFEDGGVLTLDHTLLHNGINDADNNADYVGSNAVISLGANMATGNVNGFSVLDFQDHDIADIGLIAALVNNGGPTPTHAIQVASDARDAGSATLATDQRGFARDSLADIGAFELLSSAIPAPMPVDDDTFSITEDETITPSTVTADIGLLANDILINPEITLSAIQLEYDASKSGNNTSWNNEAGIPGFDFTAANGSLNRSASVNTIAAITDSYVFDGTNSATTTNSLEGTYPTSDNSTFEFWIRPTDANVGREVIFETGSQLNGTSLVLNGLDYGPGAVEIELTISETFFLTRTTVVSLDVTEEIANGEFIHVVIGLDTDNADEITIYATGEDGVTDVNSVFPSFGFSDWSDAERVSIGGPDGTVAGGDTDFFEGEIAVVRFYEGLASLADVQQSYEAMHLDAQPGNSISNAGIAVIVNDDGTFSYDPGSAFDFLAVNETTQDTFEYIAVASDGSTETAFATIQIEGVNDDPELQTNTGASVVFGDTISIPSGSLVATDVDNNTSTFGYSITSTPTAGTLFLNGTPVSPSGQFISQADIGLLSYQHDGISTTPAIDSFDFTVTDLDGGSSTSTSFNIAVTNAPPVALDDDFDVNEDVGGTFNVIDNDTDPEGQPLTIVGIDSSATQGTATFSGDSITYTPDTAFYDDLLPGQQLIDTILYTISDGGQQATAQVNFIVNGVNDGPSIDTNAGTSLNANGSTVIDASMLSVSDPDHSTSDLTYTITGIPSITSGTLNLGGSAASMGTMFTQDDLVNGRLEFDAANGFSGDSFTFEVSDPLMATTTGTFNLIATRTISGTIFEDVNGDSDLADAVAVTGSPIDVYLYEDVDGDGLIEATDTLVTTVKTDDTTGIYEFTGLDFGDYYVVVDSTDITPSNGTSAIDRIWAEQTYGTAGSYIADGNGNTTVRTDAGAAFGGRRADFSDNASSLLTAEHVTRVSTAAGDAENVDFGFSFNVVTNHLGGDLTVDDPSRNTWVQGSLRQFIENANHIFGSNELRFTPTTEATDTDGTNAWWTIDVQDLLPELSDSSGATIINGTAYSFVDGVSLRNTNTAIVGGETGEALPGPDGIVGTADDISTVGVGADGRRGSGDETVFTGVEGSELSLVADTADLTHGLRITGDDTRIESLTVRGFGDMADDTSANIVVRNASGVVIENVVVGGGETNTSAQLDAVNNGGTNHGISFTDSSDGRIENNVVAGVGSAGLKLNNVSALQVTGNEIRGNSRDQSNEDGIDIQRASTGAIVSGNLVANNHAGGIDTFLSTGSLTFIDNTIFGNGSGTGALEGAGIRLFGNDSLVTQNIIESNELDGVLVVGEHDGTTGLTASVSQGNEISRNSFFNNAGLAIDLGAANTDRNRGDGLDAIDAAYIDTTGNRAIDRPTVSSFIVLNDGESSGTFSIAPVFNAPRIEFYVASPTDSSDLGPDASGAGTSEQFGEGLTYFSTAEFDGSAYVTTHVSGHNLNPADRITAIAIDANGNTSEFSNVVDVNFQPETDPDTFLTPEDTLLSDTVAANDSDPDGDSLTYTLSGAPIAGLNFNPDGTFTYTPPTDFDGSVTFEYIATDPSGLSSPPTTVTIDVTPVNDQQVIVNSGPLTLNEGSPAGIDATLLSTSDVDNTAADIRYSVTSGPSSGQLELSSNPGAAVISFSQEDIDNGLLVYINDSSETATDNFQFSVDDGDGAPSLGSFDIQVINAEETLTGTRFATVAEGSSVQILPAELLASDSDDTATQLIYTITSPIQSGQLELTTAPGTAIGSFSQADIDNRLLVYVHDGSDSTADSFDFTVDDGQGSSTAGTFNLDVENAEEMLAISSTLNVAEGDRGFITNSLLSTTDVDDSPIQIQYVVTTGTAFGQLTLRNNPGVVATTFTQADIDAGLLVYTQSGQDETADSFSFTVDDGQGTTSSGQFNITITNAEQVLTPPSPLLVGEGLTGTITNSLLLTTDTDDPPGQIIYDVTTAPTNGQLELTTNPGVAVSRFNQGQINSGELVFVHNGSDTTSDFFDFTVDEQGGEGLVSTGTFQIVISNSEEFVSVNNSLTVDEGQTETIDATLLSTLDSDDSPAELVYTITSAPTNGQLEFSSAPGVAISTFTQADIDGGLLTYVHNGSATASDSFDFAVNDDVGTAVSVGTFTIDINLINDAPTIVDPGPRVIAENTPKIFSNSVISIADPDAGTSPVRLQIESDNGAVTLATTSGLTVITGTGANDALLIVEGSIPDLNAALDGLTFTPDAEFFGAGGIRLQVNDLGNTGGGDRIATAEIPIEILAEVDAEADSFTLEPGDSRIVANVLTNDQSLSALAPTLVTPPPPTGEFIWIGDGSFSYTPDFEDPNFQETVTFEYQLTNGVETDIATVVINVAPPPIAVFADPTSSPDDQATNDDDLIDNMAPPPPVTGIQPVDDGGKVETPPETDRDESSPTTAETLLGPLTNVLETTPVFDRTTRDTSKSILARASNPQLGTFEFETGTYEVAVGTAGEFAFHVGSTSSDVSDLLLSTEIGTWNVPTGLALTGGLSVGWVIWSLNSAYILGSLLSTLSPWTLIDPLPVLDTIDPTTKRDEEDSKEDKLERMVD